MFFYYILTVSHAIKRGNAYIIIVHGTSNNVYKLLCVNSTSFFILESMRHIMILSIYIRHLKRLSNRVLE